MKRVVLVSTGGTIASRLDRASERVRASASGAELLGSLHESVPDTEVEVDEFCKIASFNLDLETAFRLARRIGEHLARDDVAGVAITHGTDTMEESAFLADLIAPDTKPVVFTGAQRHADEPDTDGPRNLAGAVRLAASGLGGLGAVILFDQEFHAARDATKMHAYRAGAFTSMEHGKLGEVDGERIVLHRRPLLRTRIDTGRIEAAVDLVRLVIGADARFIRCAVQTGARGLVLEAFGRGNANPAVIAGVREAITAGLPVLVSTRCPEGRVQPIYGDGGGKDLADAGAIFAGDLSGIKARVLLALLLGAGLAPAAIAERVAAIAG